MRQHQACPSREGNTMQRRIRANAAAQPKVARTTIRTDPRGNHAADVEGDHTAALAWDRLFSRRPRRAPARGQDDAAA